MNSNESKQPLIVFWALWASFQTGIFMIYHFIGSAASNRHPSVVADSGLWLTAVVPFAISTMIRWLVLPKVKNIQVALAVFVFGIAFAETTCFMGLFIFPTHKLELFLLSAVGIFQFIPFFAGRYFTPDDQRLNG